MSKDEEEFPYFSKNSRKEEINKKKLLQAIIHERKISKYDKRFRNKESYDSK